MDKGPPSYPPSYEQSQGSVLPGHPAPYHNPPTNPDYKSQCIDHFGQPAHIPVYMQNPDYPSQNSGYPAQNPGYPPQHPEYPPQHPEYPPQHPEYPPQHPEYPPQHLEYPPQHPEYPPQNPGYPPQTTGYPMQNPGYVTVRPAETTVQYVVNTVPIATGPLGPHRSAIMCPRCNAIVTTKTKQDPSILAWLSCGLLAIVGCFFGCCLIPFCIGGCQNVDHYCPHCNNYLGRYSRF